MGTGLGAWLCSCGQWLLEKGLHRMRPLVTGWSPGPTGVSAQGQGLSPAWSSVTAHLPSPTALLPEECPPGLPGTERLSAACHAMALPPCGPPFLRGWGLGREQPPQGEPVQLSWKPRCSLTPGPSSSFVPRSHFSSSLLPRPCALHLWMSLPTPVCCLAIYCCFGGWVSPS